MPQGVYTRSAEEIERCRNLTLGKHHSPEMKAHLREASIKAGCRPPIHSGKNHYLFGKHHPNFGGYKYCIDCGKQLGKRAASCNPATRCIRCSKIGKNTLLSKQIRNVIEYRQWRDDVFSRDGFICQACGIKGGRLQAHHIKAFSHILKEYNLSTLKQAMECAELWNINNGVTLCFGCHAKTDTYFNLAKKKENKNG